MREENSSSVNTNSQTPIIVKPNADFNASQRLTNVLLSGKNYIPLDKAAKTTLKGKGLLGYVTGNKVRPEEGTNEQEKWDMIDSQVMTLITNSLEPKLPETFYCKTATKLWREIEGQFGNKKITPRYINSKERLHKFHKKLRNFRPNRSCQGKIRRAQNISFVHR
jgi:hypothetical protein